MTNIRPNPYPGPRAFQQGELLYGRTRRTSELLDLLIAERIVLLYSPSGAGKTSLVQAAVMPGLAAEGFRVLPPMRVSQRPAADAGTANHYILSLLLFLEEPLPDAIKTPLPDLAQMSFDSYLARHKAPVEGAWHGDALIFDQFEEILTLDPADTEGKTEFFAQVGQALRDRNRWAIFCMREEFVGGLDTYVRPIPTRFERGHRYRLDLLGLDAARQAMQQPARMSGVDFTDAAAATVTDNLAAIRVQAPDGGVRITPGFFVEPVQLQVVCRQLWEHLAPDDLEISVDDVDSLGDVEYALRGYYADTVAAVAVATGVRERAVRDWCEGQLITTQRLRGEVLQGPEVSPADKDGLANQAIAQLVDAHLVRAEQRRGATWYELAHDRLVEPVRQDNAEWRNRHLSSLQRRAALWESEGRPKGLLLAGDALATAETWAQEHRAELEPHEEAFLAICLEARNQAERERRQAQRIQRLAVIAAIVAILAIVAAILALRSSQEAQRQTRLATSRELAAAAVANLGPDPERSILLANQAITVAYTGQAEDALRQALQASRIVHRLAISGNQFRKVTYSPDASMLAAAGQDGRLYVWSADDRRDIPARVWDGEGGEILDISYSPDGETLATAHLDNKVRLWDAATGKLRQTLAGHTLAVLTVAFSPDGKRLAAGGNDGLVLLWDLPSGAEPRPLQGHEGAVTDVAFSADGRRLATVGQDRQVILWDAATGARLQTLPQEHTDMVWAVAFSPDGTRLATASQDKTAILWDLSGPQPRKIVALFGHSNTVEDVGFSPSGACLATAGLDRTAQLWDAKNGQLLLTLAGHSDWVNGLAFAPVKDAANLPPPERCGRQLATASRDGTVRVWNIGPSTEGQTLIGHGGPVESAVISADGRLAVTGSDDGTARLWDATSGRPLLEPLRHQARVNRVALSPDGKILATASWDGTGGLWDVGTGKLLMAPLAGHGGRPVESVAFSPDGARVATAGDDGRIVIWEVSSGRSLQIVDHYGDKLNGGNSGNPGQSPGSLGPADKAYGVAFSPDGKLLATTGADGNAALWDIASGKARMVLPHGGQVYDAAFSPDGKQLATASWDSTAKLWDVATGKLLHTLAGHTDRVYGVQFSPDGLQLATSSSDRTVKMWDAATGALLRTLPGPQFNGLSYSRDGGSLLVGSEDGTARQYLLEPAALRAHAASRVTRSLTTEECQTYFHVAQCPPGP